METPRCVDEALAKLPGRDETGVRTGVAVRVGARVGVDEPGTGWLRLRVRGAHV